jgi:hypothetical protein
MRARLGAFAAAAVAAAVDVAAVAVAAAAVDSDVRNTPRPIVVPQGGRYNCHWAMPEEEVDVAVASEDTGSPSCSS